MPNKDIGVINEQGFVAGDGLGFNQLSESDKEKLNLNKDERKVNESE